MYGFSEEVALSNDLEVIRDQVRRYLDDTVKPERLKDLLDQPGAFDGELWAAAVGQGWPAVSVPEELGGLGLGWPGVCVLMEELGRASVSLPLTGTAVTLHALRPTGGPEVVEGLSAALIAGERSVCIAFGEGGDAGIAAPPAVHYADGRLHGRKAMAAFAAVADYALVNARWAAGFGLFLVPLDQNGVHRRIMPALDNGRAAAALEFADAGACPLGDSGMGEEAVRKIHALAALITSFEQIGGAQRSMEMARDYALERVAFGQPIGRFQAIKHKLADMYWRIEVARGCALDALAAVECGAADWMALAAAARLGATEAYEFAARENIQTHGGIGMTWEAMPQHYYRRSRALALEMGGPVHWRDRLIEDAGFCVPTNTGGMA